MKISIIDLETTGLDPKIHEIIEIGCIVFDSETFAVESILDVKVKPLFPEIGDLQAYKVNGYNKKEWKGAIPLKRALKQLASITKETTFCAHNMIFDWSFLQEACDEHDVELTFSHRKLDLYSIAWAKLNKTNLQKFSLKSICEYLDIQPEPDIHRAVNGASCEYEVFKKLMK